MNEIEKLYENAGIEPIVRDNAIGRGYYIEHQRVEDYPPFTAEKQLAIEEFIMQYDLGNVFECGFDGEDYHYIYTIPLFDDPDGFQSLGFSGKGKNRKEALAGLVNDLWQDLTEEEKEQIRSVLK